MNLTSEHRDIQPWAARSMLDGLPESDGYLVVIKPLRYRARPHLAARTEFDERRIVLQVPTPFLPFGEIVPYGAKRVPGNRMRFVWLTEGVTFHQPREVLRFLYCHEWMHWYLREGLGRKSAAETACDRFALRNYLRPEVTVEDARLALNRNGHGA
jgi:hypothetical protein